MFGVAVLAVGILYNVQVSGSANSSDISLAALANVAVAQSEGGGSGCVLIWDGWDFVESCPDAGGTYPGFVMDFDERALTLICIEANSTCNVHDQG